MLINEYETYMKFIIIIFVNFEIFLASSDSYYFSLTHLRIIFMCQNILSQWMNNNYLVNSIVQRITHNNDKNEYMLNTYVNQLYIIFNDIH